MKLTPWMLAVAAFLIIAAMAVGFLFKRLFAAEAQVIPEVVTRNIPMALSDILPGTRIDASFFGRRTCQRNRPDAGHTYIQ